MGVEWLAFSLAFEEYVGEGLTNRSPSVLFYAKDQFTVAQRAETTSRVGDLLKNMKSQQKTSRVGHLPSKKETGSKLQP